MAVELRRTGVSVLDAAGEQAALLSLGRLGTPFRSRVN